MILLLLFCFFFSSRRRHTRCALVTGVQTCALPISKPFDPRLIVKIAPAVAQAAALSGVARRPIEDLEAYRQKLMTLVYHTGQLMRPLFMQAKSAPKRVIYADGEDERVLRAAPTVVEAQIDNPIQIGKAQCRERVGKERNSSVVAAP